MSRVDLVPNEAYLRVWEGSISVQCPGVTTEELRKKLSILISGFSEGLFGSARLDWSSAGQGGNIICVGRNAPGSTWILLVNLLAVDVNGPASLIIETESIRTEFPVRPEWYGADFPDPLVSCNLTDLTDVLNEFLFQFFFVRNLSAYERAAFCEALDAWAALVDAGAFPIRESLNFPSVIAGYSGRFEDPATGAIFSEGIAASPCCFGLLINLGNLWHRTIGLTSISLSHTG